MSRKKKLTAQEERELNDLLNNLEAHEVENVLRFTESMAHIIEVFEEAGAVWDE